MKNKILSIVLIIIIVLSAMFILLGFATSIVKNRGKEKDNISGYTFVEKTDKSLLKLNINGTFKYYQNEDDLTNNYYEGTYELYNGKDAIDFIANDLEEYGVTEKEQKDMLKRNSEYELDNYYCLVLKNEKCIIDGENILTRTVKTPYFGFYLEDSDILNITNMNSANTYNFVKE